MTYLLPVLFMVLYLFQPLASSANAETLKGEFSVAYCIDCAPFQFKDRNNQPAGYLIDLWHLWAQNTGLSVKFIPASWNDTLSFVRTGKADAHAGLFYNKQRDTYLDYGPALHKTETHVFFHRSITPTIDDRDLTAYRVGAIRGDYVEGYLKARVPNGLITGFANFDELISAAKGRELKVFAADTPTALYHLEQAGIRGEFVHVIDNPLYTNNWAPAVKEGNRTALELVNEGMKAIQPEERERISERWFGLQDEDAIRIAINKKTAPFSFLDPQGKPAGMYVDLWQSWADKIGQKIKFVFIEDKAGLNELLAGKVDIHTSLLPTQHLPSTVKLSRQLHRRQAQLYYMNHRGKIEGLEDFSNKTIGVLAGSYYATGLKRLFPNVKLHPYTSANNLMLALQNGSVEAFVHDNSIMDDLRTTTGEASKIKTRPEHLFVLPIHAGTLTTASKLQNQIETGFDLFTTAELIEIEARWIKTPKNRYYGQGLPDTELGISIEEREWLNMHPIIRLGSDRSWLPYEYLDKEEKLQGLSASFLKRLEQILGVVFQQPRSLSWAENIERAKNKELDILTAVASTPERKQFLNFSTPYMTWPNVIATRGETSDISDVKDLNGKRVGVVGGYAIQEIMAKAHPDVKLIAYNDIPEGLLALSTGHLDAFVDSFGTINHYTKQMQITNLVVVAPTPHIMEISFGIRDDWPELRSIFDKTLAKISTIERTKLIESLGLPSKIPFSKGQTKKPSLLTAGEAILLGIVILIVIGALAGLGWLLRRQRRSLLSSIQGKSILFLTIAFILVGGVTLWAFVVIGGGIVTRLGEQIAERQVLWYREKILGAVEREIALAKQMSESSILAQWAVNEDDTRSKIKARHELQSYRDNFRAKSYFVALASSQNFYFTGRDTETVTLDVVDVLSADDEDDAWFFSTIKKPDLLNLNVDHNAVLGVTNLWINHAMRRGDNTLGIVGTGVRLSEFVKDFISLGAGDFSTMIIDLKGRIQAHVDHDKITKNSFTDQIEDETSIWHLIGNDEDREVLRYHLTELREGGKDIDTLFLNVEGHDSLVAISYLAPLKWYTVAVFDPSSIIGAREESALIALFAAALMITILIFAFGQNMLIIRPLALLTQGAKRMSEGDYEVRLTSQQQDEIGDLNNTFNQMVATIANYTEDLKVKIDETEDARAELLDYKNHLEELVDERTSRLSSIIDTAVDGVIVINEHGIIESFSPAAETIFGYPADEVIGQNVKILMNNEIASKHDDYLRNYLAGGSSKVIGTNREVQGRRKDGSFFAMDLAVGESALGEERIFTGIVRDITQRKAVEDKIARAEERTQLLLASVGDGIFGTDNKGRVNFVNTRALELLGYKADDLMGKPIHNIIHHSYPDGTHYPVENCPMWHAYTHGDSSLIDDEVLWRSDGTPFSVEYTASPMKRNGEVVGSVIAFRDISERLAAQEKVDAAHKLLTDSIRYASRIQRSLLPADKDIRRLMKNSFIIWEPRDVVGGDLYWVKEDKHGYFCVLFDCTGHGVPGALMTTIAVSALEVAFTTTADPARLISRVNQLVKDALDQTTESKGDSDDGLEMGICLVEPERNRLTYAGARFDLMFHQDNGVEIIRGDKSGVGYRNVDNERKFTSHSIRLRPGQRFYMYSDGVTDQIGGERRRAFGRKRLIELVKNTASFPMDIQKEEILKSLKEFQGDEHRRDDLSMVGFMPVNGTKKL